MLRCQRPQLADDLRLASEGEIGVDELLQHGEPLLLQRRGLSDRRARVHEVDERGAPPERQCGGQRLAGGGGASRRQFEVPSGGELLEAVGVDRVCRQVQVIAGVVEHQIRVADLVEHSAQARDVALQGAGGRCGQSATPEQLDQRIGGDGAATCRDKGSEDEPGLAASDVDRRPGVVRDLQRPEHPEQHRPNVPGSRRLTGA